MNFVKLKSNRKVIQLWRGVQEMEKDFQIQLVARLRVLEHHSKDFHNKRKLHLDRVLEQPAPET
jgi:hypothetical protein